MNADVTAAGRIDRKDPFQSVRYSGHTDLWIESRTFSEHPGNPAGCDPDRSPLDGTVSRATFRLCRAGDKRNWLVESILDIRPFSFKACNARTMMASRFMTSSSEEPVTVNRTVPVDPPSQVVTLSWSCSTLLSLGLKFLRLSSKRTWKPATTSAPVPRAVQNQGSTRMALYGRQ